MAATFSMILTWLVHVIQVPCKLLQCSSISSSLTAHVKSQNFFDAMLPRRSFTIVPKHQHELCFSQRINDSLTHVPHRALKRASHSHIPKRCQQASPRGVGRIAAIGGGRIAAIGQALRWGRSSSSWSWAGRGRCVGLLGGGNGSPLFCLILNQLLGFCKCRARDNSLLFEPRGQVRHHELLMGL